MPIIIIPAGLEGYRSMKDKTLKLTFETPELSPEKMGLIHSILNKPGYLAFNPDAFTDQETDDLSKVKVDVEDTTKTRSQRLRGVLYRNYEQNTEGYPSFADYYASKMEQLIEHYKTFLP